MLLKNLFDVVKKLLEYEPATVELNPERVKDLFKRLYGSNKYTKIDLEKIVNNSKPWGIVETDIFIYDFDTEPAYK